ncbi:hypothetical protein [Mycobacterium szulgai]|uniref:Uncharacterized protein n=1 Tax=Mycobacterium szulgai TaxID=1787 RepID=A0A1X2DNH8_MYCSZ|nr:hypothetical protein [Mycobacterium szulgai]MCV7074570.1 hypothetical protein [Mycobacterium szulgai]ORW89708.1 hypothetical protein AWC27_12520 [Mycobacterium szulgai]
MESRLSVLNWYYVAVPTDRKVSDVICERSIAGDGGRRGQLIRRRRRDQGGGKAQVSIITDNTNNNSAYASGPGSNAKALFGANNVAFVAGSGTVQSSFGNNNIGFALGTQNTVQTGGIGDHNVAFILGSGGSASAVSGNQNVAIVLDSTPTFFGTVLADAGYGNNDLVVGIRFIGGTMAQATGASNLTDIALGPFHFRRP